MNFSTPTTPTQSVGVLEKIEHERSYSAWLREQAVGVIARMEAAEKEARDKSAQLAHLKNAHVEECRIRQELDARLRVLTGDFENLKVDSARQADALREYRQVWEQVNGLERELKASQASLSAAAARLNTLEGEAAARQSAEARCAELELKLKRQLETDQAVRANARLEIESRARESRLKLQVAEGALKEAERTRQELETQVAAAMGEIQRLQAEGRKKKEQLEAFRKGWDQVKAWEKKIEESYASLDLAVKGVAELKGEKAAREKAEARAAEAERARAAIDQELVKLREKLQVLESAQEKDRIQVAHARSILRDELRSFQHAQESERREILAVVARLEDEWRSWAGWDRLPDPELARQARVLISDWVRALNARLDTTTFESQVRT